jgi:hypothetical protein
MAEIQRKFGSDTTPQGIQVAMTRYFKPVVKLVNKTVADGGNLQDLDLCEFIAGQTQSKNKGSTYNSCASFPCTLLLCLLLCIFGSLTRSVIDFLVDVQRHFGDDTTPRGIQTALERYWKPKAELVRETLAAGGDLKELDLLEVQLERNSSKKKGQTLYCTFSFY